MIRFSSLAKPSGVVAPFNRGVEDDPAMDVYEQFRKKP
jgi:hypothetical protein